jgi:toxin ParE1/3/4
VLYKDIRRALLRRFPYGIFYLVEPEQIVILACFHARRHPKQWQRRR